MTSPKSTRIQPSWGFPSNRPGMWWVLCTVSMEASAKACNIRSLVPEQIMKKSAKDANPLISNRRIFSPFFSSRVSIILCDSAKVSRIHLINFRANISLIDQAGMVNTARCRQVYEAPPGCRSLLYRLMDITRVAPKKPTLYFEKTSLIFCTSCEEAVRATLPRVRCGWNGLSSGG